MIDHTLCTIQSLSAHYIGNKANGQALQLSQKPVEIGGEKLRESLLHFFLDSFDANEFFTFDTAEEGHSLGPHEETPELIVHSFARKTFSNNDNFHLDSMDIARQLFACSYHPNIKAGDLYVVYFTGLVLEDEVLDAIGLFKSEQKHAFLQLHTGGADFNLQYQEGTAIDKLDKGCLIFNANAENGYKVCIVDKSNRSFEAQYWRDSFLRVKPMPNNYFHTTHYIRMAKDFVVNKLDEDFPVTKADKIDYLNKSVNYFKTNETLVEENFTQSVFGDEGMGQAFQQHREAYGQKHELPMEASFQISPASVKKQERTLRSVLKLDKNFHIYIHGDRQLIERGFDEERGKYFYKVYFEEEQ